MSVTTPGSTGAAETSGSSENESARRRIAEGTVRLTVVAENAEVDLALPIGLPLLALLPSIAAVIRDRPPTEFADERHSPQPSVGLYSVVGEPYDPRMSLAEHGVREGAILLLRERDEAPAPPLFDDVAIAVAGVDDTPTWSSGSARTAACGTVTAASAATAVVLVVAGGIGAAIVAAGLALVLIVSGCVAGSLTVADDVATSVRVSAVVTAFATGWLLVPGGDLAANAVLGFGAAATASVVCSAFASGVGRRWFTAVTSVALMMCVASAVRALTSVPVHYIGAVAACLCVVAFTWAPRLSAARAGIRVPPVPLADAADSLDRPGRPGRLAAPSSATRAAAWESALADFDVVQERARAAQNYLTGYFAALSVVGAVGATVCAIPLGGAAVDAVRLVFALLVTVVLCQRARMHTDRVRVATGVVCGAGSAITLVVASGLSRPDLWPLWASIGVATALVAVLVGSIAPHVTFSPVVRRTGELAEYAAIVSILPLACVIVGALTLVREL